MLDVNRRATAPVDTATVLQIGPILIGGLLSWMLFGISIVQLYIYHVSFGFRDHRFIQVSVYTIFLLDIFQSIVAANEGWQTLIAGWGRPENLRYPGWTFIALPIVSTFVSMWVQTFYAWRIRQLGRWTVVPGMIVLTALIQAGGAWALAIGFAFTKDITSLHETRMYARAILWLGGGAFTDITIMCSMLYLLYAVKQRIRSFEPSELMVNRLIRLSIETGSACALSAILQLILFLGVPETNIHLVVALILSKIYSNTLMSSLNARPSKSASKRMKSGNLTFRQSQSRSDGIESRASHTHPVAIHITREVEVDGSTAGEEDKVGQSWEIELEDVASSEHHPPCSRSIEIEAKKRMG
ncbi:hypothetical protein C8Q76DRAFT_762787 [Earliella scabrosa]|nr:hypothetical protein C8Q76DRAFT_762787 [Earliella scabrosa]